MMRLAKRTECPKCKKEYGLQATWISEFKAVLTCRYCGWKNKEDDFDSFMQRFAQEQNGEARPFTLQLLNEIADDSDA